MIAMTLLTTAFTLDLVEKFEQKISQGLTQNPILSPEEASPAPEAPAMTPSMSFPTPKPW